MNRFAHTCGSSIGRESAVLALLRERYPSSRATISSMRTRPSRAPRPSWCGSARRSFSSFFPAVKFSEGNIKLRALHVHVHADEPVLFRQSHARFNGIIEEIAENAAEIELHILSFTGMCASACTVMPRDLARDILLFKNGVRHGVAGFDDGVHGVQIGVQLVEIGADGVHIALAANALST